MTRVVKGGLVQASVALDGVEMPARHREAMIEKHLPLIEEAAGQGVQVLCLQEMFTGPYFAAEQDNRWIGNANTYGVLKLRLKNAGYRWKFVPVAGKTFTDSGFNYCHQETFSPLFTRVRGRQILRRLHSDVMDFLVGFSSSFMKL